MWRVSRPWVRTQPCRHGVGGLNIIGRRATRMRQLIMMTVGASNLQCNQGCCCYKSLRAPSSGYCRSASAALRQSLSHPAAMAGHCCRWECLTKCRSAAHRAATAAEDTAAAVVGAANASAAPSEPHHGGLCLCLCTLACLLREPEARHRRFSRLLCYLFAQRRFLPPPETLLSPTVVTACGSASTSVESTPGPTHDE